MQFALTMIHLHKLSIVSNALDAQWCGNVRLQSSINIKYTKTSFGNSNSEPTVMRYGDTAQK